MDEFLELALQRWTEVKEVALSVKPEMVHKCLFVTPNFPIFFVIQNVWICMTIRRFAPHFSWYKSYFVTGFMSLFSRILAAYFTLRRPPIFEEPLYIPVFSLVWYLVNCSPFDIVYKVLSFRLFFFGLQHMYSLGQVREVSHGVDVGLRGFPASPTGAILISMVLSSTECIIWLLTAETGVREFSTVQILRNLATSCAYFAITQYPELFNDYISTRSDMVKLYALALHVVLTLLNQLVFGLRSPRALDITFLTYFGCLFAYKG